MNKSMDSDDHELLRCVTAQLRASRATSRPLDTKNWLECEDTETGQISYAPKALTYEYHRLHAKIRGLEWKYTITHSDYYRVIIDHDEISSPTIVGLIQQLIARGIEMKEITTRNGSADNKLEQLFLAVKSKNTTLIQMYKFEFERRMLS